MPIIGREPPADIIVNAPQVSARHAEIEHLREDTYVITDLGSSNGTWVNGNRVQSTFVRPGDQISLGSQRLDLRVLLSRIPRTASAPAISTSPKASMPPPPPPRRSAPASQAPALAQPPPSERLKPTGEPGLGTDLAVALAAQKSFTGKAFGTWFLYWLFWLPGVIMNFVFMSEAKQVERLTGQAPPGKGCLTFLLITHFWLPLFGLVLLVLFGGAVLSSFFRALGM